MAVVYDMMTFPMKTHRQCDQCDYGHDIHQAQYSEESSDTVEMCVDYRYNSRQSTTASLSIDEEGRDRVIDIVSATISNFDGRVSLMVADENKSAFAAVSPPFAEMIGCKSVDLVGTSCRWISYGTPSDPEELLRLRTAMTLGDSCTVRLVNCKSTGELFVNLFHIRRVTVGATSEAQVSFWVGAHEDATGVETCTDLERIVAMADQSADKLCNMIDEAVQSEFQHEEDDTLGYATESEIEGHMDVRGNIEEDCRGSFGTKWLAVLVAGLAVGAAARCLK